MIQNKILFLDCGVLKELTEKELWCVFRYTEHEDATEILNQDPYIFDSYDEFIEKWNSKSMKNDRSEWEKEGLRIVIRPVKIYTKE